MCISTLQGARTKGVCNLKQLVSVLYDSLESELESLRDALLKARLDATPPKTKSKSPGINLYIFCDIKIIEDITFLNFNIY